MTDPTTRQVVAAWHDVVADGDPSGLDELLAADCTFLSPVVHTPQEGREATALYLAAAMQVFADTGFRYVGETVADGRAVLEFVCELDDTHVHGIDMIDVVDGRISRFVVMVRPLRGIQELRRRMARMLERSTPGQAPGRASGRGPGRTPGRAPGPPPADGVA